MVNVHFVDDLFLTIKVEKEVVHNTLDAIKVFRCTSRSKIQQTKIAYYLQSNNPKLDQTENTDWKWIQLGEMFKLLGIPFGFHISLAEMQEYVLQRVAKKLNVWNSKFLLLLENTKLATKCQLLHMYATPIGHLHMQLMGS